MLRQFVLGMFKQVAHEPQPCQSNHYHAPLHLNYPDPLTPKR